ncbi:Mu transposase C-terminal domain-containing protein [Paenibacillus sedimenti]|uniref:DDE-type integrase/transposase/recombinase n=1 Tax=Paenibacillus sedimenti TaxID=2770274 RepID=A0A926KPX2_9BACL|nr:Mu transposase C-terminal domain-containing protein [Paenibacillus sedimenti]MBD0380986.1 DDE-type integrase/transposase/recombinase [Paenibacillus sedimenti]
MDGSEYVVKRSQDNEVVAELINYKQQKAFSLKELEEAWDEDRLAFEDTGKRSSIVKLDIDLLTDEEKNSVKIKLEVLRPVINGYFHSYRLDEYLRKLREEKCIDISRATFYNWKRIWDKYGDARYLVDGKKGPKYRRTKNNVMNSLQKIMDENMYSGEEVNYRYIYRLYKDSIKKVNELRSSENKEPLHSFQTIWRIIKEQRDLYRQMSARDGHVAARLQRDGVKSVTDRPERPLQRVELDWTPVDIYLVDPKTLKRRKPWLVYAIDVYSGNPLGFYITFDYPDSFAIKQCLLHCILPKVYIKKLFPDVQNEWTAYGIPKELVVDNASSNNSYDIEEVCSFFGIDPLFPEVAAGHKKGTVERWLKTFNDMVHTLKGTSFANIFERKQYDSEGNACITLQAFYYIAHIIFVDIISHNYSHSRFGGTPHQIWEKGFKENIHLSKELPFTKKDIKLALCGGRERRIINNKGVVLEEIWFWSDELMKLRNQMISKGDEKIEVIVRFDYSDVSKVYIQNPYDGSFIDAYPDPNTIKQLSKNFGVEPLMPLPFQQIKAICLQRGRERRDFDDTQVIEAMKLIKQIQNDQVKDKKQGYIKAKQQEVESLSGISLQSITNEELGLPAEIETFQYLGELTLEEMKSKRQSRSTDKEKLTQPEITVKPMQSNKQVVVESFKDKHDELPLFDVILLGDCHNG